MPKHTLTKNTTTANDNNTTKVSSSSQIDTNKLRILHQNIAGICNKADLLDITLNELVNRHKEVDILCFSETNVKQDTEKNVKLDNYKLISSFCRDKNKGGTCIMTKKTLDAKPLLFPPDLAAKFYFECCGIDVPTLNLIVIAIYRIPNHTKAHIGIFLHKLEQLLEYISVKFNKKKIVICGDWNIDILKENTSSKELKSVLENYNFNMHILTPTRQSSCIDQIASNVKNIESETLNLCLSDHETAQMITLNIKKQKSFTTWFEYKKDYSDENLQKFTECISALSFSEVLNSHNVAEAFDNFYDILTLFYNLCFPTIKVKVNSRLSKLKWLSKGLKKSCRVKRKLYLAFCTTPRSNPALKKELHTKYKKYNCILKKCILKAQKVNNKKYIDKNRKSPKAIWNTISSTIANNINVNNLNSITINNEIYSDPQDICNAFNKYFIDLTNNNDLLSTSNTTSPLFNTNTLYLTPVTDSEIYNISMSLKNSKTSGHDAIITKIIKLNAMKLSIPLSHIINLSFEQGYFPDQLKLSIVKPLFKKGDKRDPGNYRPITIIPILSKIFEKAMYIRLNNFFTKHNILHPHQYGFRKGSSTSLACFDLVKYVSESLNNRTPIISIFLDMSKAFDFVSHQKLLHKLENYGVRGKAYEWLQSYLKDRKQCTEISQVVHNHNRNSLIKQNYRSSFMLNSSGVPQGSILAPILFLSYINDLPNVIKHKSILFADDTTLIIKCDRNDQIQDITNKAFTTVVQWLESNNLNINISKTKFMQYRSHNSYELPLQITYNQNTIDKVNTFKFLGLIIDQNLNWKGHIDHICNKLNRYVYALKRLRQTISTEAALAAYHGYVASVLSYGLIIWGNSVDIDRAFKIQKKCLRAISNARFRDSCKPLFQKYNILPLPCIYIRDVCYFVKSHPEYYKNYTETSSRNLRNKFKYIIHKPPSIAYIYKQNVYNMSIVIYNKLPTSIKILEGNAFRKSLSSWLTQKCFYNIKEYLEHDVV